MTAVLDVPMPDPDTTGIPLTATVDVADMRAALAFARRAVFTGTRGRRGQAIMHCVHLSSPAAGILRLYGTDYEAAASADIAAPGAKGDPVVVIARELGRILGALPKSCEVGLVHDGDVLRLVAGDPKTNSIVTYRLPTMAASDYPAAKQPLTSRPVLAVTGQTLAALIRPTVAAGTDDTLPVLTGLHIAAGPDGIVETAATDRYRLIVQRYEPVEGEACRLEKPALVPARVMRHLAEARFTRERTVAAADEVDAEGRRRIRFTAGGRAYSTLLIDGTFPDYVRLLPVESPDDNATVVSITPGELAAGVKRVAAFSHRNNPVVLNVVPDASTVAAYDAADIVLDGVGSGTAWRVSASCLAKASASLPGVTVHGDPVTAVAFNPAYMLDALSLYPDTATIAISIREPNKPFVLTCTEQPTTRSLLMPVRLAR